MYANRTNNFLEKSFKFFKCSGWRDAYNSIKDLFSKLYFKALSSWQVYEFHLYFISRSFNVKSEWRSEHVELQLHCFEICKSHSKFFLQRCDLSTVFLRRCTFNRLIFQKGEVSKVLIRQLFIKKCKLCLKGFYFHNEQRHLYLEILCWAHLFIA